MKKPKTPFTPQFVPPPPRGLPLVSTDDSSRLDQSDPPTVEALIHILGGVYKDFLPHQETIQKMAKRALDLQTEIYRRSLIEAYPEVMGNDYPLILSFSAREPLPKFQQLMAALAKDNIQVAAINYDPKTFTFSLYGTA